MMPCPDRIALNRLLDGRASEEDAPALEQHLLSCDTCCQTAQDLHAADARPNAAQVVAAAIGLASEQAVLEVAERVAAVRLPDRSAAVIDTVAAAGESTGGVDDLSGLLDPPEAEGELGRFGGYRVLRLLGSGGMGLVWEAEDTQLCRRIALKVMKRSLAQEPEHRQRFLREARAAAAIDHPHIVTVYQVGEHRKLPFLAMQLLQGETLEDRLRRSGRPPLAECLRIGREMAEALAVAHRRGLVHRDVKPGNTWLEGEGGWVKLVDFGLAHALADDSHLTRTGAILGTPAYMSPEQARGEAIDERSDLFSLGAVLYRLATGAVPFQGSSTLGVLTSLALHNPPPPREIDSETPPAWSDLIMRLLAKNPCSRPASAQAVAQAIRAIEQTSTKSEVQSPKSEVPPSPESKVQSPKLGEAARRRVRWPRMLTAAGAAAMLLAGIIVIIRDKEGNVIGQHPVPEGGSVTVAPTLRGGDAVAKGDQLAPPRSTAATLAPPSIIPEPPSLDEWLEGRKVLTVSQDGRGQFKTIQAALDTLQPGQAVEVLDGGPYRETLAFGGQKNVGLFSRAGAAVTTGAKRESYFEGDVVEVHNLSSVDRFRLSGVTFLADAKDLTEVRDGCPWFALGLSGNAMIENCHFAGGRPGVEMLVYWRPEAPPGTACTIRDCLFDTAIAVNVHEGHGRAVSTVERNWFRSSGGYFPLYIDGSGERTVIRHNIFDVGGKAAVGLQDTGSTGRLELCNNTVFGWINFGATDPDRQELFLPLNALIRNNLFHDVVSCRNRPGLLNAAAKGWQIGNNEYAKEPDSANQLSPTPLDFTGRPRFLARDPTNPQYVRLAADSDEAHRGTGGARPGYVGALPPGPAPADGDWLTRWITK